MFQLLVPMLLNFAVFANGVDPVPTPPNPLNHYEPSFQRQAGIGSNIPYSRRGVLELGGGMTFIGTNQFAQLSVTPTIGWFLADNVELSAIMQMAYNFSHATPKGTAASSFSSIIGLVEPSLHLPIIDSLFIFGGLGIGTMYQTQSKTVGVALAPRLGLNALVGRSGILTPSATWNWSSNSAFVTKEGTLLAVNSTYGVNINYTVMW